MRLLAASRNFLRTEQHAGFGKLLLSCHPATKRLIQSELSKAQRWSRRVASDRRPTLYLVSGRMAFRAANMISTETCVRTSGLYDRGRRRLRGTEERSIQMLPFKACILGSISVYHRTEYKLELTIDSRFRSSAPSAMRTIITS